MRRKVSILARSMILTLLLTLVFGSLVVHAEDEVNINFSTYTVNLGDEYKLQLKMVNQKPEDRKPRWVSYNVNVATVDQDGYVTPIRKGTAIISSGIGIPRQTCVVTVVDPSVELNKSAATIYRSNSGTAPGNKVTLTAKVSGATRNATDIVWSSSNEEVAKVVKDARGRGVVTSTDEAGEAVITARVNGRTASCKVTVLDTALELSTNNMQLSTRGAGSSIRLVPTVVGPKRTVTWTSSDRKIATVSGGKVTGKKEGTVIVTAKANGVEATCTVTVKPGQISINKETELLYVAMDGSGANETKELKTNVTNGKGVTWTSSDDSIVTVVGKTRGKAQITAESVGKAVITAECDGKTDTCTVIVKEPTTSITENEVRLRTRGASRTYTLDYHVEGRNKANKAEWTSDDTSVVSVSRGKLVGKKAGSATVTLSANGIEDKVLVTVTDTPTISLDQKEYALYTKGKGNTVTLKATVDGASKQVTWVSDNSKVAEVNTKGKITAKSAGRALITATANGVTAKCWVDVKETKIILDKDQLILAKGEKKNLCDETYMEIIGESQAVTYKSSAAKTVAVDKKGNIEAKNAGKATITIKANGVERKCNVTVSTCEEHQWVAVEGENTNRLATCEESGLSSQECSVCHGVQQTVTPPLGHSFGKWIVVSNETETEAGLKKQVCKVCKAENTKTIPAKNKSELAYGYKLVWEDNFNGTELNRDDWNVELHEPGWVNEEWQKYVDSTDNIYVKDGNLVIQAIKDGDKYTSGRINTQNKHDYMYGRFEARAKVPSGKGFLPAFWMMPTDENYYGQWPKCGEIDIMEVLGDQTQKAHSTLHFGEPHTQQQGTYTLSEGDFSDEFHVYACEWDPGEFRFYVDGNLFYTVNDWFTQKPGYGKVAYPAPYDQPFYMILNLAVGGSWVGYPDDTTKFEDNAQLVVDYVRVYAKDKYDTDVVKPEKEVILRNPDENGNYIINGDFAKVEDLVKGDENWQLLTALGGEATAEIKENELHITTTAAGTADYSVQIVQAGLPIEKGSQYKLTYDAYADEGRTMITDISAPDLNYIRYLADTKVTLTTEKQSFEHIFDMTSEDDANGRLEFNLGNQGSTAKVHISNVKLVKTDGKVEVKDDEKSVLPDGNYVYNGTFDEGNEDGRLRLAYWDWDISKCRNASVSVTGDAKRELKVVVPDTVSALDDVIIYQDPIAIMGGRTFRLSFDAYADREKTIKTTIAGKEFESTLTKEKKAFKYEFETAADLNGSELRFLLGVAGTTYIDNVSIRKVGAETGLIVNGDFSNGLAEFEPYVHSQAGASATYTVDGLKENDAFSIDIESTGDANKNGVFEDWYIQLKQNNIKLEKDKWYKLDFKAKSTLDRQIKCALQRDGSKHNDDWTPYFEKSTIDLTNEYQTFSYTFKMKENTDPESVFSITMGSVGGNQITTKHTIVIDDITLVETDSEEIPSVEVGTELIKNGEFLNGKEDWMASGSCEGGAATFNVTGEEAIFEITNVGDYPYSVQLKQEGLTLEEGASYEVKFNIESSVARDVIFELQETGSWKDYGTRTVSLEAGVEQAVKETITVDKASSKDILFFIGMGKMTKEVPSGAHTIKIDNVSVKKVSGSGGTGDEPVVGNLIKNGNFTDGDANWVNSVTAPGAATVSFENGKAEYNITNVGTGDWHVQLKQENLTLEKGAEYKVSFKIKSSAARTVKSAIMNFIKEGNADGSDKYDWYAGADTSLTAGVEETVTYDVAMGERETSSTIQFVISMGQYADGNGKPVDTPASTIEIDDVSVVKVGGAGGDTEDDPVIEDGTDLIKDGNFTSKDNWAGSGIFEPGAGTFEFKDGKAVFDITNVGEDTWHVQLKQTPLKLETGAEYQLSFNIKSTAARIVNYSLKDPKNGYLAYCDENLELKADTEDTVNYTVKVGDKKTSKTVEFVISMGQMFEGEGENKTKINTPVSKIEISNVSLVKGSGKAENLIQNGKFAEDKTNWSDYFHKKEDGTVVAEGKATFTDGKARYEITNAGTADWHVQLKQEKLTMEKGAKYKVNLKIGSSIDRDVKLAFMGSGNAWCGGADIHLKKDKLQSFSTIVDFGYDYQSGTVAFQLSMGNYAYKQNENDENSLTTELEPHAIEIYDISVTKVEDGTAADEIKEIEQEITPPSTGTEEKNDTEETTPPANNSDDSASDNSDDTEEVQDDQNIENPDEISDDTADDEDADPADDEDSDATDQETSDEQDDSGDAETSDAQNDSGSGDVSELSDDGNNEQTSEE